MTYGVFSRLMADSEQRNREGAVAGLRLAEVKEITDDGLYILEWLSGPVRSRSAPARAAHFMAGKERGAYFPFEVDDEVIVGFVDGNIDQPIILGALWSDIDAPPSEVDTSDTNNTRAIVSRQGSRLSFDDTKSGTKVLMRSAGGIEILLDDLKKSLTLKLNATTKIVLDASGVTVTGAKIKLN